MFKKQANSLWDAIWENLSFVFLSVTFEDKRKENYEKGRMELDRRRKEIQERLQKEKVTAHFNGEGFCLIFCS